MKLFESVEAMSAIPKLRRPHAVHTTDQVVGMAARLGWTVGITADDLVGDQCRAVIGLGPQDDEWRSGKKYVGVCTPPNPTRRRGRKRCTACRRPLTVHGGVALVRPARPARHLPGLRHAGP